MHDPSREDSLAVLAQGAFGPLQEMQRVLRRGGVEAEILRPPEGAGSSWGTRLWLAVAGERGAEAARLLEEHWRAGASEAERRAADHVVDLDAEETGCPACGERFAPAPRCPGCGLRLG